MTWVTGIASIAAVYCAVRILLDSYIPGRRIRRRHLAGITITATIGAVWGSGPRWSAGLLAVAAWIAADYLWATRTETKEPVA